MKLGDRLDVVFSDFVRVVSTCLAKGIAGGCLFFCSHGYIICSHGYKSTASVKNRQPSGHRLPEVSHPRED